ncbi:dephospho-CoA kinase [Oceanobacter sp. 3_MG-2023]|jgi:dephospho-CoA kinase|uniref:dephospho-CoA kinase n=1 Tax=Oceanobacter sp. 3_MG-2023 TaxID=3062622 RepID=UPI00351ECB23
MKRQTGAMPLNWVLGITGGIGCGKTAASDYLANKGIHVVDSDQVARQVVEPGQPAWQAIVAHFGDEVLQPDQQLNRAWLRSRIFEHPQERHWLEQQTHPVIRQHTLQQLAQAAGPYAVLASPLLFESGQQALVHRTLVIDLPESLQLQRASQRDDNSEEQIRRIIKAQISRNERLQRADDIIDNSGPLTDLQQQLDQLHQGYLSLASSVRPS